MSDLDPSLAAEGGPIVDAIIRSTEPFALKPGERFVVQSTNGTIQQIDTHDLLERPARKTGEVSLTDADSFVAYVNQHAEGVGTLIVADVRAPKLTAVLNWHGAGDDAGWGDHRVGLEFRHTPEWDHWFSMNGRLVSQTEFAEHLETGAAELVSPPAADMLQLAKTFQATKSVEFKEATVLESGARQFVYQETVASKAGQTGDLEVPSEFSIGVAPFEGTEPYRVTCRLRYKIESGGLRIGYQIHRPHLVIEDAVNDVVTRVESDTGMLVLRGGTPRR